MNINYRWRRWWPTIQFIINNKNGKIISGLIFDTQFKRVYRGLTWSFVIVLFILKIKMFTICKIIVNRIILRWFVKLKYIKKKINKDREQLTIWNKLNFQIYILKLFRSFRRFFLLDRVVVTRVTQIGRWLFLNRKKKWEKKKKEKRANYNQFQGP